MGLLVAGRVVQVPGVNVIPPASVGGPAWATLDPGDCRMRHTSWVRQVIMHTVRGQWPQPIKPGAGPGGEAARYADIWQTDPLHSGSHLLIDSAGTVACLADLAFVAAYHAEMANDWSVGVEMMQFKDGSVYQATLDAAAMLAPVLCDALGIPFQIHASSYRSEPLARMELVDAAGRHQIGGPDVVGIVGHRDETSNRGRGDPGDAIYAALIAAGAEPLDYSTDEDLRVGAARQATLVVRGERILIDGKVGPASLAAARRQGFVRWSQVPT